MSRFAILFVCLSMVAPCAAVAQHPSAQLPTSIPPYGASPDRLPTLLPEPDGSSTIPKPPAPRNSADGPSLGQVVDELEMPSWFGWTANAFESAADALKNATKYMRSIRPSLLNSQKIRYLGRKYGDATKYAVHGGGPLGVGVYDLAGNAGSISGAALAGDGVGFIQETSKAWLSGRAALYGGLHGARIGVQFGTLFGPEGSLIGGVVGGVVGGFAASFLNEQIISRGVDALADKIKANQLWAEDFSTAEAALARIRDRVEKSEQALHEDRMEEADRLGSSAIAAIDRLRGLMDETYHGDAVRDLQTRAFAVRGAVARRKLAGPLDPMKANVSVPTQRDERSSSNPSNPAPPAPSARELSGRWGGGNFTIQSSAFDQGSDTGCDIDFQKEFKKLENKPMPLAIDMRMNPDGTGAMQLHVTPPASLRGDIAHSAKQQQQPTIPVRYENGRIVGEINDKGTTVKIEGEIVKTDSGWTLQGGWEMNMANQGRTVAVLKGSLSGSK